VKIVDFHPEAGEEAHKAALHYASIRPELGEDFRTELGNALARIQDNPLMYAAEARSCRIAPLHRFPYGVIYKDLPDQIWIAAVAHHSRRPGYWSRRRPG
jgi:hypothetical protein